MIRSRNTVQKEQIYAALTKLADHPTADRVYEAVKEGAPKISRATVYRVLNQLADSGAICRINVPGSAAHYDHISKEHSHVRCLGCGRVFDLEGCPRVDVDCSEFSAKSVRITGYELIFDGICNNCE